MKTLINLRSFPLRIIDFISLVIGLGIMLAWNLANKNWILSNIISASIIISCIKLLKTVTFKKALILFIIMQSI